MKKASNMFADSLQDLVRSLVNRLASGDIAGVLSECDSSRLSVNDLKGVITEYGRTLVEAPPNAYDNLDAVRVISSSKPTWSVQAPLWSEEEGRSDLTLELTVLKDDEVWRVELDDLHVL